MTHKSRVPWEWRAGRVSQWWSHGCVWRRAATSNQDGERGRWTWGRRKTHNHVTSVTHTHTLPIQAVLHLKVQIKCPLITGTGETWWREAARCGWRCPCSEARGRLRGRAWRRSTGSCPSTGTEAQLWQNNMRTKGSGDSRRVQFFFNVICFDRSHNDENSNLRWSESQLVWSARQILVSYNLYL